MGHWARQGRASTGAPGQEHRDKLVAAEGAASEASVAASGAAKEVASGAVAEVSGVVVGKNEVHEPGYDKAVRTNKGWFAGSLVVLFVLLWWTTVLQEGSLTSSWSSWWKSLCRIARISWTLCRWPGC